MTTPKKPRRPGRYGLALPHLQAWREYRIMSKKMLAAAAGLSGQSISNYENGAKNAKVENVHKLAEALRITPEQLVHEEPPTAARHAS